MITDEMLGAFATTAAVEDLAAALKERYAGIADRLSLYKPFSPGEDTDFWRKFVNAW